MLRFILKRNTYDGLECREESLETIDCEVPNLESLLVRGGYGGGPNNDAFDHTKVFGVELLPPPPSAGKDEPHEL